MNNPAFLKKGLNLQLVVFLILTLFVISCEITEPVNEEPEDLPPAPTLPLPEYDTLELDWEDARTLTHFAIGVDLYYEYQADPDPDYHTYFSFESPGNNTGWRMPKPSDLWAYVIDTIAYREYYDRHIGYFVDCNYTITIDCREIRDSVRFQNGLHGHVNAQLVAKENNYLFESSTNTLYTKLSYKGDSIFISADNWDYDLHNLYSYNGEWYDKYSGSEGNFAFREFGFIIMNVGRYTKTFTMQALNAEGEVVDSEEYRQFWGVGTNKCLHYLEWAEEIAANPEIKTVVITGSFPSGVSFN